MKWMQISVKAKTEESDAVAELMQPYSTQGVSIEYQGIMPEMYDDGDVPPPDFLIVRVYIPVDDRAETTIRELETTLSGAGLPTPTYVMVDEQDWAEAWKAHYHTTRLGERIVVRPLWEEAQTQPGDILISLDPGMAFGTGTHQTTQLCLIALEHMVKPGIVALDMGCGSGILAIAAVKLGASKVVAVDNDPVAVEVTIENAQVNEVEDRITALTGSLETVINSPRRFDLLIANIIARIIIDMCENGLGQVVRPGGLAVFSGIVIDQVDDVKAALKRAGLEPTVMTQDGDWVALEAYRPAE